MPELDGSTHVRDEYEVTDGYVYHRTESGRREKLGPGDRFHPTRKQVETGTLKNKVRRVREVSAPATAQGADIGLRALPMTDAALDLALESGLSEDDFSGLDPAGTSGKYLKSQVEALVEGD